MCGLIGGQTDDDIKQADEVQIGGGLLRFPGHKQFTGDRTDAEDGGRRDRDGLDGQKEATAQGPDRERERKEEVAGGVKEDGKPD